MGRVETTDTGRVDQGDAAGEEWVGEPHLDELDTCPPIVAVALGDPAAGLVGGDRLHDQLAGLAPANDRSGLARVVDHGHGHRGEVVVDRADVAADERVDQRALALLELADDADDGVGPSDALGDDPESVGKVVAAAGIGKGDGGVDGCRDLGRIGRDRGRGIARRVEPGRHRRECTLPISARKQHGMLGARQRRTWGGSMAYSLGIDLGTTYPAAATAVGERVEIFQLGERAATIPSIVVLRADGEVLTGDAAERRSLAEPTRTAREFKRRLGDPTPIILGGTPYGAEALIAHLLKAIVARVTTQMGSPPDSIVVTHPASYGAYKIDLLEQAIRQADIENVTLLTEPEAAAIHYAGQERVPAGAVIAVYDFGGGTFDATILRKTDDGFEQLGRPEGMERLGGIDFDEALFTRVVAMVRADGATIDPNDPATLAAIARLREECRRAKEALSSDTDTTIAVALPGLQTEMRLTREEFEEMIRPRITETIGALGRAAKSAGLDFDGLDRVLLVGGSSRIPLVAEMVREATGRPIAVDAHPKHSMALGAAMVAEMRRSSRPTTRPSCRWLGRLRRPPCSREQPWPAPIPTMRPGQPGRLPADRDPGRRGGGRDRHDRRRHGRVGRCRQQHPQHRVGRGRRRDRPRCDPRDRRVRDARRCRGHCVVIARRLGRRRGPIGRLRVAIAGADAVTHHRADPDTRPHPRPPSPLPLPRRPGARRGSAPSR